MQLSKITILSAVIPLSAAAGGPTPTPVEAAIVAPPAVLPPAVLHPEDTPRWEITLGAGAAYVPEYEGSDEFEAKPFPFVSLEYGRFSIGPDAIGFDAWRGERGSVALSLGYGGGRDPEDIDSGALDGFAEIDDAAILGLRYEYEFGAMTAFADLERYLGESDGTSLELGVMREAQVSERLSVFASASATLSDGNYMERYFGVTAAEAAASGYDIHEAGAGLRRIDVGFGANYGFSENWMLKGEIGAGKLLGDAADSPIVLDDVQPQAMLAVAYRF